MSDSAHEQFFAWAATFNLNWVVKFHNEVQRLFKSAYQSLDSPKDGSEVEVSALREIYRQFDGRLHINTFLMLQSHLEEWLFHSCKDVNPPPDRRRSGIERFKKSLTALGVHTSGTNWQFLKDAETVRNCLLHANGRISLSKNSQELQNIVAKYPKELNVVLDRLVVLPDFLERFVGEIRIIIKHAGRSA